MSCSETCVVLWDEKEKVLKFPEKRGRGLFARGLTKALSAQFYPFFSISAVLKDLPCSKPKKHGKKVGNRLDAQLETWANQGVTPKNPTPRFQVIQRALTEKRWIPLRSQLAVGCRKARLATKIDLICLDEAGRVVLVELKCGFDDYFDVQNQGCLEQPFDSVPVSYKNNAMLQLGFTLRLYHHTEHPYHHRECAGAFVLHVYENSEGDIVHEWLPLKAWAKNEDTLKRGLMVLEKSSSEKATDRKRKIKSRRQAEQRKRRKVIVVRRK